MHNTIVERKRKIVFDTEYFKNRAREIHGNKYDYSLVVYKKHTDKVKIGCEKHGIFEQTPDRHFRGAGCLKCARESIILHNTLTTENFIEKAIKVHGNKYDYSLVIYKNTKSKIKIKCFNHGIFEQIPNSHLCGNGCPLCRTHGPTGPHRPRGSHGRTCGPKTEDLTGRRFGELLVVKGAGKDEWGSSQWFCKCNCGKEILRSRSYFFDKVNRKNIICSCGCAYKHKIKNDLTGKRFGKWSVIRHDNKTDNLGRHFWLCRCDCGNEKIVGGHYLYGGNSKSCGCYGHEVRLRGLLPGESGFKRLLYTYKKSVASRKLTFCLSDEEFKKLVSGNCYYCGRPPLNSTQSIKKDSSENAIFLYNGIDRTNNLIGYEKDNVVSCCGKCNRMKHTLKKDDFIKQCILISKQCSCQPHQ